MLNNLLFYLFILYSIAHRMIYSLSNAGGNPNITDGKGNTPLHEVLMRGFVNIGLDLVQVSIYIINYC